MLFIIGTTSAQTLNDKGLYIDSEGELFTGTVSTVKNNIKNELAVKNGVISGTANYYYTSGKLMESGTFENGLKDKKWIRFNENGTISATAFYNLGKKTGTWLVYDDLGNKRFEMNYNNGDKTGIWTNWGDDGSILSTKSYASN